jgi:phosphoesterase RecJ-like protein
VNREISQAISLIDMATNVAIVSHERPDGDAIGSLIAASIWLGKVGKEVTPILIEGVPKRFRFLPGAERVQKEFPAECDLLISVDCSAIERIGFNPETLPREIDLNIDHHPTNTNFGVINIVEPDAVATAEILYDLSPHFGFEMDAEIATNLLTGLVTDTIGFRTSNVSPKVLEVAARLIEYGAQLNDVYYRSLNCRNFVAAQYWGRGLSHLERRDGMVWCSLTLDDRKQVGYPGQDDADLINFLSTIDEAEIYLIFVEQPDGKVKVSWRSRGDVNVAEVASEFGGGGHHQAAGALVTGDLEQVKTRVLTITKASVSSDLEKLK